jgi:hypothetical protein
MYFFIRATLELQRNYQIRIVCFSALKAWRIHSKALRMNSRMGGSASLFYNLALCVHHLMEVGGRAVSGWGGSVTAYIGGFIKGILRGVRRTKSLRVLFLHRRPPSWTTLVLYSRAVFIFNEPALCDHSAVLLVPVCFHDSGKHRYHLNTVYAASIYLEYK